MQGNFLERGEEKIAIEEDISMDLNSPFFDRDEVIFSDGENINPRGTVVQPFTNLSGGDVAKIVGHIDKFQMKNQPRVSEGWRLVSDGIHIDTGNLQITRMDKNLNRGDVKYSFNFFSGDTDNLLSAIGEKTLKDLAMDGIRTIAGGTIDGPGGRWGKIIDDTAPEALGDDFVSLVASGSLPSPNPILPNDVWADLGQTKHAATAVYAQNIVSADDDEYICFPTLKAFTGDKNDVGDPIYRIINRLNSLGKFATYTSAVIGTDDASITHYTQIDNPLVPMYKYHQVLRHIFSEHGYTLNDDWLLEDEQFLKLAFVNTFSILKPLMVHITNIFNFGVDEDVLYYEQTTTIDPRNHLPSLSILDFLRDFMLKFCVYFDVKGKEVTIVHQEIDTVQREVKDLSPDVIIDTPAETGIKLKYELDNDSYQTEKKIIAAYSDLPDETELADLANDDWYIDRNYNFIYKNLAGDDALQASNLIPYNTGKAKEYTMSLSPVNCAITPYAELFDVVDDGIRLFVPFVHASITGYDTKFYNYEYDHNEYFTELSVWISSDFYNFISENGGDLTEDNSLNIIGFYHGVMGIEGIYEFPYMSFHNYLPDINGGDHEQLGDWHLGIIGTEGLVETFYGSFMNIYNNNRKFIIKADETFYDMKKHQWNKSIVCRSTKLYIGIMKTLLPLRGRNPIFECWEV